jgi:ABC-2 type transport system permease protein
LSAERTSGGGLGEPGGFPSESPALGAPSARPRTLATLGALYRLLLRTQLTVARVLGIAALSSLSVLLGVFSRWDSEPAQAATDAITSYGLALVVPLATLWLGTSAIGDLVEDRLLVYLWLKPVPRWQLPAAAVLATASVLVPPTAVPLAVTALVAGAGEIAPAAFLAAALGGLAYAGVFVAAGLWFRRAAWWGLAFVLLWENAVAQLAEGSARFTVVGWASSILATAPDIEVSLSAGSAAAAFIVLPAIAFVGWLLATWRYRRADID